MDESQYQLFSGYGLLIGTSFIGMKIGDHDFAEKRLIRAGDDFMAQVRALAFLFLLIANHQSF